MYAGNLIHVLTCLQTAEKMGITTGSGFDMFVGTHPLHPERAQSRRQSPSTSQFASYSLQMTRVPPLQAKPPTSSSCSPAWGTMSPTSCGMRCCQRCKHAGCAAHAEHGPKDADWMIWRTPTLLPPAGLMHPVQFALLLLAIWCTGSGCTMSIECACTFPPQADMHSRLETHVMSFISLALLVHI